VSASILVVLAEPWLRESVYILLEQQGYQVEAEPDQARARERLKAARFDVLLFEPNDTHLPEDLLAWLQRECPTVTPLIVAADDPEAAALLVRNGAFDYVLAPGHSPDRFLQHVDRAVRHKELLDSHTRLVSELQNKTVELENRFGQLELAHGMLQAQAVALHSDLARAQRIQRGLLPKHLPFEDKISLSVLYKPLGKVGGDLYDVFQVDEEHLALYVADASGHGISSAMLTVFLKHAVKEVVAWRRSEPLCAPDAVLAALNQMIIEEAFEQGLFVSMTYILLNVNTLMMRLSSAGHPPVYLRRADGTLDRLRVPAPVLGINPKVQFACLDVQLKPGDNLVLYSDGITEARDESGAFFGEERLVKALNHTECHPDFIAAEIERSLLAFIKDRHLADDITLAVLGAEPQRAPFYVAWEEPRPTGPPPLSGGKVLTAVHDRRTFISISGSGTWRESQHLVEVCERVKREGGGWIILDLGGCGHLDSTFLGVLHNVITGFEKDLLCRFELQNLPRTLLREMSELGLTSVLMHFRPDPAPLPESMRPLASTIAPGSEMGRLLLSAHEALVEADPANADRFAAVLKTLRAKLQQDPAKG
jgi:serine phosphatase RsbU (regulator of sigma subunit)